MKRLFKGKAYRLRYRAVVFICSIFLYFWLKFWAFRSNSVHFSVTLLFFWRDSEVTGYAFLRDLREKLFSEL
ncbi:MAG: hypothetical protein LBJ00_08030 [Planctomycetaceae bacterium]|nr:hypothetical protein [Planctomycetaceae bacterium]